MDDQRADRASSVGVFFIFFVPAVLLIGIIDRVRQAWIERSYSATALATVYAAALTFWINCFVKWGKKS